MDNSNPLWKKEPYKTAVILPTFWNENEKEYYYLMGKDKQKDKIGLNDWSAFGGYRDAENNETSPLDTAIREAIEESIGLLAELAESLRNNKAVTFVAGKMNYTYVIDIFPKNEKDRWYDKEQIDALHDDFTERYKSETLIAEQKEKLQIGWMKASEITQKILNSNKFTVYAQPSSSSFKLTENAELRFCQKNFFKHFCETKNDLNNVKNGWSGLEGKTIELTLGKGFQTSQKNYGGFRKYENLNNKKLNSSTSKLEINSNNKPQENLLKTNYRSENPDWRKKTNVETPVLESTYSAKPWNKNQPSNGGSVLVNTNNNSRNNGSVKPWDNYSAEDSQSWKTQNNGKNKSQSINNSNVSQKVSQNESKSLATTSAEVKLVKKPWDRKL
jgi:hypothetical protein